MFLNMSFCFYHRSKLSLFQSRVSLQKASVKVSFSFVFDFQDRGSLCGNHGFPGTLFTDHAGLEICLPLPLEVLGLKAPLCLAEGEYLNSIHHKWEASWLLK